MKENKLLAEYLFDHRKNNQTYSASWIIERFSDDTWEQPSHMKFLHIANQLLEVTDFETAKKIAELGLFYID